MATRNHFVMRFEMRTEALACAFASKLKSLGITAEATLAGQDCDIHVVLTDTRALAHAAELNRFIYGGKA